MNFIKVWCEYDINGDFGGNNNEKVFYVSDSLDQCDIDDLVSDFIQKSTGLDKEELDDMYDWEYIKVSQIGM